MLASSLRQPITSYATARCYNYRTGENDCVGAVFAVHSAILMRCYLVTEVEIKMAVMSAFVSNALTVLFGAGPNCIDIEA